MRWLTKKARARAKWKIFKDAEGVVPPLGSADRYAVVLTRVPTDPEVALGCSTLLAVLPS
jgi:hypothetical protein